MQFVTRPPASRASFLGDVVESIVESLVQGNTAYLAAGQARQTRQGMAATSGGSVATEEEKFTRPIFSRLGTRERYDARVIPFHNNTDHQVFNMAPIGIPAVTFTNWPDDYIHSTDDDLWQIDPTQLKRNAVAVAGSAWFIATAGAPELRVLSADSSAARWSESATTRAAPASWRCSAPGAEFALNALTRWCARASRASNGR